MSVIVPVNNINTLLHSSVFCNQFQNVLMLLMQILYVKNNGELLNSYSYDFSPN